MAANMVGTDGAHAPAGDPHRAVAEHLPDAAVVLFDLDLRIQLTTGARAGLDASDVTVDLHGLRLDPVVETVLFRGVQQAVANVEQHANARRLRVALHRDGPQVILAVEDDGSGFDPLHTETVTDAHGFGLSCMRERLQAVGGQLTLRSAPGAGTCIEARAPSHAPP